MTRLVASDLDGTLLRSDGRIGDRTKRVLEDLERAGLDLVLVTGRPPRWMRPITDQISHRGVAICANGGLVLDLATSEVLRADPFPEGVGFEVLQILREALPDLAFGVEWVDGFAHEPRYPKGVRKSELYRGAAQNVERIEDLFSRPTIKLLARSKHGEVEKMAALAQELVGEMVTVTHSSVGLLEMSAPGVTKAAALDRLAAQRDIGPDQVMAFGDQPNDLPMLGWAGHAVAVANAHHRVLDVADEVTASNNDEGVAVVLERLLAQ